MSVTDLQSHVMNLMKGGRDAPQHSTISLETPDDRSLWDKGMDSIAAQSGLEREKPKSELQMLMDRRRREISRQKEMRGRSLD